MRVFMQQLREGGTDRERGNDGDDLGDVGVLHLPQQPHLIGWDKACREGGG